MKKTFRCIFILTAFCFIVNCKHNAIAKKSKKGRNIIEMYNFYLAKHLVPNNYTQEEIDCVYGYFVTPNKDERHNFIMQNSRYCRIAFQHIYAKTFYNENLIKYYYRDQGKIRNIGNEYVRQNNKIALNYDISDFGTLKALERVCASVARPYDMIRMKNFYITIIYNYEYLNNLKKEIDYGNDDQEAEQLILDEANEALLSLNKKP